MRRFIFPILGAAILALPTTASADPTKTIGMCSLVAGGNFCGTVKFTLTNAGTGLEARIFNGINGGTNTGASYAGYIQDFLVYGLPYLGAYVEGSGRFYDWNSSSQTITAEDVAPWANWDWSASTFTPSPGGNPFGTSGDRGNVGISTCTGPVDATKKVQTCQGGAAFSGTSDYVLFRFTLLGAVTEAQFNDIQWAVHVQGTGNAAGSLKCYSGGTVAEHNCTQDDPPGGPNEIVPEPATMTLLATGLAGLAAASRRRRKQS